MMLFVCLSAFFSSAVFAGPQAIANHKDLNAALKTAKTIEDHKRIGVLLPRGRPKNYRARRMKSKNWADYFLAHPSMYGKVLPDALSKPHMARDNYHQLRIRQRRRLPNN